MVRTRFQGAAAAELTKLALDGSGGRVRPGGGADYPGNGKQAIVAGVHGVGELRHGYVHHGDLIEAGVADIGDHADHLAGRFVQPGPHVAADGDEVADGIGFYFRPIPLVHGPVDEHDSGGELAVLFGEEATAQQADAEHVEVAWRNAVPRGHAVIAAEHGLIVAVNGEGHHHARLERNGAGSGGCGDAGNGEQALVRPAHEFGDMRGGFKLGTGERHTHGEDILLVEAAVGGPHGDEGADQEPGGGEQNQGKRHFRDDQRGAAVFLRKPMPDCDALSFMSVLTSAREA